MRAPSFVVPAADAAETTAFLARTSGLSGTETAAYKALINGLVSDGIFAKLDALYITATKDTTTANLNLVSTSFGLTQNGTVTFSADHGYTGNGTDGFMDTGFTPSTAGGNFTQNSASVGIYQLTSRSSGHDGTMIGVTDVDQTMQINFAALKTDGKINAELNSFTFPSVTGPANAQGCYVLTRQNSTTRVLYRNGSSFASGSLTTVGIENLKIYLSAFHGAAGATGFGTDQFSAAFIGGGLSSTESGTLTTRLNDYMTALGINVF